MDRLIRRWVVFAAFSLVLGLPALADGPELTGRWEGAIELPGTRLEVQLDFARGDDGALSGEIDIPLQGAVDIPLISIVVTDEGAQFEIKGIPGQPTFNGSFSEDGTELSGEFTQGGQTLPFELTRTASAGDVTPAIDPAAALAGFDEWIEAAMADWKVPGLAIAVVKDDEVVYAKGFGLRDVENELPVDADTLFAIGSATKAFTATLVAMSVSDGTLDWDTPVVDYLPRFRLWDEVAMGH